MQTEDKKPEGFVEPGGIVRHALISRKTDLAVKSFARKRGFMKPIDHIEKGEKVKIPNISMAIRVMLEEYIQEHQVVSSP